MKTEETRALFESLMERLATGTGGFDEGVVAEHYVQHQHGVPQGLSGVREYFSRNAGAFADVRSWAENVVIEGDKVSAWMCMEGRHVGTFFGVPATGRVITIKTADTFRAENGKFVEHWAIWDPTDYLEQMGALPEGIPLPWPERYDT